MKKIWTVVMGFLIVGSLIAGGWALDDRFAKSTELQLVESRLELKILQDRMDYICRQMKEIEHQFQTIDEFKIPPGYRERYIDFKLQKDNLNKQISELLKKKG